MANKGLVSIALIIIIIQGLLSYNLYYSSNYDANGIELNCFDTIKNVFGFLPILEIPAVAVNNVLENTKSIINKSIKKATNKTTNVLRKKEVFNIDNSDFTYEDAELACKAYGAELATYDQLIDAHNKGAQWCNYGWSKNQHALFPTQQLFYDNLQKGTKKNKKSCGKPGINGGYFKDKNLKFGANCYGFRPDPEDGKIIYNKSKKEIYGLPGLKSKKKQLKNKKLERYKRLIKDGAIEVRPFSDDKWSRFSWKKSTYMLTPKQPMDIPEDERILIVEEEQNELDKDPRKLDKNEVKENKSKNKNKAKAKTKDDESIKKK